MKAKKIQRLSINERSNLGEILPLEQPYVLLIDPSNLCNLRCKFCPSGYQDLISGTGRVQKVMNFDLYKKIIDDTSEFNKDIKVLRLYKEGEPLINPNFDQMIYYAKRKRNISRIDTTTNGVLLNPELNRKIIDAGIDQINISVNGVNAEQIFKYTNRRIEFSKYVENIRDLYEHKGNCEIYIKAIEDNLTQSEQQTFYEIFGEISDRIYLERLSPAWPDFEFNSIKKEFNIGNYGQEIENRQVCPYIFYVMVINSDGTVSTCVGDWKHNQILGDTKKNSLKEIWFGTEMRKCWESHLELKKDCYNMCENCKVIVYGAFDNIDSFANSILTRLQNNEFNYK